jgi:hypothetical protein
MEGKYGNESRRKMIRSCGQVSFGSGRGPLRGSYEHGNEISGSIKGGEFLELLSDCQLLKKDCAPWN